MAAAAQQVQRSLDGADRFAHAVTYVGGAALGSFAAIELAAGGVMQGALAAEETSVGASQVINVATQIAEGIVADVGGGGAAVPSLVGAGGVGVRMAGQVGDDISRATSRASALATTGSGGTAAERTIGEILEGVDPDALIHLTPESAETMAGGVLSGNYWARLEDVEHLTVTEFQRSVVGPSAAAGPGRVVSGFVVSRPGAQFIEESTNNGAGVMEYVNVGLLQAVEYFGIR